MKVSEASLQELYYQALETELGGIDVYETALMCAVREDLREQWKRYLEQTRRHREIVLALLAAEGLDPEDDTPGRDVVRAIGAALVSAMERALEYAPTATAQLVAAECVVLAETKDHLNWALLGEAGKALGKTKGAKLRAAVDEVEDEKDRHLFHSAGWLRELWIEALGMPAVLPPPEEKQGVSTATRAARVKRQREDRL
jgi:rubrerythrin